jgi:hypothetical protein
MCLPWLADDRLEAGFEGRGAPCYSGNMLASLLPGLRDLRAPLAAGALWLLFGWLVLEPRYAEWDKTDTPLGAVISLRDTLTPVAFAAVASFVAYLIGSISETLYSQLPRHTLRLRRRWGKTRSEDRLFELRMPFLRIVQSWLVEKFAAAERVQLDQGEILRLIESDLEQTALARFLYEPEEVADEAVVNERCRARSRHSRSSSIGRVQRTARTLRMCRRPR